MNSTFAIDAALEICEWSRGIIEGPPLLHSRAREVVTDALKFLGAFWQDAAMHAPDDQTRATCERIAEVLAITQMHLAMPLLRADHQRAVREIESVLESEACMIVESE